MYSDVSTKDSFRTSSELHINPRPARAPQEAHAAVITQGSGNHTDWPQREEWRIAAGDQLLYVSWKLSLELQELQRKIENYYTL